MNLNPVSWYRFRKRLVVERPLMEGSKLNLYRDPDSGEYYVSIHRYHPIMTPSIRNRFEEPGEWI